MCTFVKEVQDGTVGPSGGWGEGVVPSPGSEADIGQLWSTDLTSVEIASTTETSLRLPSAVPWGQTPVQQPMQWLGNHLRSLPSWLCTGTQIL